MSDDTLTINKISPINRRRLLLGLVGIGYGVFFGEIYSYIHFSLWLVSHLLVIIGLGAGLLWPALRQRKWPVTAIDAPLLALGIGITISAWLSPWPRFALEGIFPWLSHVLAFYLMVRLMRNGWADSLIRGLMLVTGVVILIGLFELAAWYFGLPFVPQFSQGWWEIGGVADPLPPTWPRLSFTLANAVVLSAYLVLVIPLAVAFLFTTRRIGDLFLVALFVIAAMLVFSSAFSRGGWLGLGAGLSVLAALWLKRNYTRFTPTKRRFTISMIGLANLVAVGGIIYLVWTLWDNRAGSNAERIAYWKAALYLFNENPIWGIGPGLFRWGWRSSPFAQAIPDRIVTAHSLFLNQLAELGTVGGLAGLWLLVVAGVVCWRVLSSTQETRLWWRRAGCAAGLVGFLVQGFFEALPIWPIALPVIILSAYLISPHSKHTWLIGRKSTLPVTNSNKDRPGLAFLRGLHRGLEEWGQYAGPILAVAWLLGVLLISYFAYPRALAEKARSAMANNQNSQAIDLMSQSNRLDPTLALYQFEIAGWLADPAVADYRAARIVYQHALAKEPTYGLSYANLAMIEWHLGNRQAAINDMTTATQLAPGMPQFWLTQGVYAEEMGNHDEARLAYTQAILTQPDWVSSMFWQATPWREENLTTILTNASTRLPPLQRSRFKFQYHLQTNNLRAARQDLSSISQQAADSYFYHLAAGELYLAQNNLEAALDHTQQAIQRQPSHTVYALLAEILFERGNLDQAEQTIKRAIFLGKGSSSRSYYVLGRIKEAQGLYAEAEAAYWRGYSPQTFSLDYSVALYRQLSSLKPLPMLQNTSGGPIVLRSWFALANLYKHQGRFQEANKVYNLILSEDPFLTDAELELAELCRQAQTGCNENNAIQ